MKSLKAKGIAICVCVLSLFMAAQAMAAGVATVQEISGVLDAKMPGSMEWTSASVGDSLSEGTQIRTPAGSIATLVWGNGHVMKVQPMSTVTLAKLVDPQAEANDTELNLSAGEVIINARKLVGNESFNVATPSAVAGIRGTILAVGVTDTGEVAVMVVEGSVMVDIGGELMEVTEGFQFTVDIDGNFQVPEVIPQDTMQQLQQETPPPADPPPATPPPATPPPATPPPADPPTADADPPVEVVDVTEVDDATVVILEIGDAVELNLDVIDTVVDAYYEEISPTE